jgi:putative endonuclease
MAELFYVYILSNAHHTVFYIGATNDLIRRVYEHKNKLLKGFSYRYNVDKLLYYETTANVEAAILREKQVKRWRREIKCDAISRLNPEWVDLYKVLVAGDPGTRPG